MIAGTALGALALIVPDYDSAIAFFTAIGFRLTADIDQDRKRWVTVQPEGGGVQLVLARADTTEQTAAIGNQGAGRVWLFLQTDDFAATAARITAAGGIFEESPRDEPYGSVAVWRDIWGNRWDLIQPAPAPKFPKIAQGRAFWKLKFKKSTPCDIKIAFCALTPPAAPPSFRQRR